MTSASILAQMVAAKAAELQALDNYAAYRRHLAARQTPAVADAEVASQARTGLIIEGTARRIENAA